MNDHAEPPPVRVHVANPHEISKPCGQQPHDTGIITRTFTLKTGQTQGNDSLIQRILDRDPHRTQALVVVASGTVYLCHSSALAEAAVNDSAGTVGGAQDGFILAAGIKVTLHTTDPVYAAVPSDKASAGALVSVITERRRA